MVPKKFNLHDEHKIDVIKLQCVLHMHILPYYLNKLDKRKQINKQNKNETFFFFKQTNILYLKALPQC